MAEWVRDKFATDGRVRRHNQPDYRNPNGFTGLWLVIAISVAANVVMLVFCALSNGSLEQSRSECRMALDARDGAERKFQNAIARMKTLLGASLDTVDKAIANGHTDAASHILLDIAEWQREFQPDNEALRDEFINRMNLAIDLARKQERSKSP